MVNSASAPTAKACAPTSSANLLFERRRYDAAAITWRGLSIRGLTQNLCEWFAALSFRQKLGFGRAVATREARSRPQFGPHHFGIGCRSERRSRWRRSARLFRERSAFDEHPDFVGVEHFAFQQSLRDAFENIAMLVQDAFGIVV